MALRVINWIFIGLQITAGALQMLGTFIYTDFGSNLFAWSLSAVLTPFLLASLSTLQILQRRKPDQAVSYIAFFGNIVWLGFILLFGKTQGTPFDPRIILHATAALGLAVFSLRSIKA